MNAAASAETFVSTPRAPHAPHLAELRALRPARAVDHLLDLSSSELDALYRDASVPSVASVRGDLKGRMLAWSVLPPLLSPGWGSLVARGLRAFAGSSSFPWRGKTFSPKGEAGEGKNRIFSDRLHLFRFTTFVAPSRGGAFDAVQLDYDHPENPRLIRAVKDEIRELAPGLWLGQAYLVSDILFARGGERPGGAQLVVWFGLANP